MVRKTNRKHEEKNVLDIKYTKKAETKPNKPFLFRMLVHSGCQSPAGTSTKARGAVEGETRTGPTTSVRCLLHAAQGCGGWETPLTLAETTLKPGNTVSTKRRADRRRQEM